MAREPRHLHRLLALFDRRTLAASSIVAEMISGSFGYKNNPSQKVTPSKFWSHAPLAYSQNVGGRFRRATLPSVRGQPYFLSKIEKGHGACRAPLAVRFSILVVGPWLLVATLLFATTKSLYSQSCAHTTHLDARQSANKNRSFDCVRLPPHFVQDDNERGGCFGRAEAGALIRTAVPRDKLPAELSPLDGRGRPSLRERSCTIHFLQKVTSCTSGGQECLPYTIKSRGRGRPRHTTRPLSCLQHCFLGRLR